MNQARTTTNAKLVRVVMKVVSRKKAKTKAKKKVKARHRPKGQVYWGLKQRSGKWLTHKSMVYGRVPTLFGFETDARCAIYPGEPTPVRLEEVKV